MDNWVTIERPGYLGKKRDEVQAGWDEKYGKGSWRIAYQWGDLVVPREVGIQIYEDGYYEFFKKDRGALEWITSTASDVYDTAETNVSAGFSYEVQETPNNHLHDVAIRRAVMRNGAWFKGDKLLEVRSRSAEGWRLSPCMVSFHLPNMILPGETKDYPSK